MIDMEDTIEGRMRMPLRYRMAEIGLFAAGFGDIMYHDFTNSSPGSLNHVIDSYAEGAVAGYVAGAMLTGVKEFYRFCREENRRQPENLEPAAKKEGG